MRQAQKLADMLGGVREEIKLLKLREAAIREALLALRPNGPVETSLYTASIRRGTRRSLDAKRLPDAIRDDPRYWTVSETCTVTVRPRRSTREKGDADDFQVVEDG